MIVNYTAIETTAYQVLTSRMNILCLYLINTYQISMKNVGIWKINLLIEKIFYENSITFLLFIVDSNVEKKSTNKNMQKHVKSTRSNFTNV